MPTDGRDGPAVSAILAWIGSHSRDVDEAPFWREFVTLGDPGERFRYLQAYVDRRPLSPLNCPRPGRTMDADAQRALVTVAYLRGDFADTDLPRVDSPWTWPEVTAYAMAHGGDGWDSLRDSRGGPVAYKRLVARDALRIVCQPAAASAVIASMSKPINAEEIGAFLHAGAGR